MEILSYSECLKEMFALGRFGIKLELETISGILKRLGSPEKRFRSIHIAGTNGKGSIASYVASILRCSGFTTGLYTSPHLIKFNERFCINGNMVSDDVVVESYLAVKNADTGYRKATFFEISTAMAFYIFAKSDVEWAVIETGMGGRLDATNVLDPAVTIISNLSIEHTEYLGDTIEQIAAEKGGIIKQSTPLVTGATQRSAIAVLHAIAAKQAAPVYEYGKEFNIIQVEPDTMTKLEDKTGQGTRFTYKGINVIWEKMETRLPGLHQIQNSALALATCELIIIQNQQKKNKQQAGDGQTGSKSNQNRCQITEESVRKGLAATKWPGRLEYIMKTPLVVIDGAHNLDAAENLGKYLQKHHGSRIDNHNSTKHDCLSHIQKKTTHPARLTMIIGILNDKPYKEMLSHMLPAADRVIFTRAGIDRSLDPKVLKDFATNIINVGVEVKIIENVGEAVEYAINEALNNKVEKNLEANTQATEEECICVAGSLYVAGEAREKILKDFLTDSDFQS